jgi:hypothetical protein
MFNANSFGESESCSARWKRVPAAGMRPADSAVEPRGDWVAFQDGDLRPGLAGRERGAEPGRPAPTTTTCATVSNAEGEP